MDGTRPTLPQRVTAVLHAKQYLVFFAIGLYTLDFAVPLASAWLYRREPLAELLTTRGGRSPTPSPRAARSSRRSSSSTCWSSTWLRAGYIRSLVGPFHLGPADRRQFLRLLALQLALEVVGALVAGAVVLAGDDAAAGQRGLPRSARLLLRRAVRRLHHRDRRRGTAARGRPFVAHGEGHADPLGAGPAGRDPRRHYATAACSTRTSRGASLAPCP